LIALEASLARAVVFSKDMFLADYKRVGQHSRLCQLAVTLKILQMLHLLAAGKSSNKVNQVLGVNVVC
jgi:hypothetical protein